MVNGAFAVNLPHTGDFNRISINIIPPDNRSRYQLQLDLSIGERPLVFTERVVPGRNPVIVQNLCRWVQVSDVVYRFHPKVMQTHVQDRGLFHIRNPRF